MADRFSLKIEGFKELAANLRALPDALQRSVILDALKESAEPMRARMGQLAPRRPGAPDIADNIGISVTNRIGDVGGGRWEARSDSEHAVAVGPTKNFFYGIFLEYGHRPNSRAYPFMRPAFDTTAQTSLSILSQRLWDAIRAQRIVAPTRGNL
jgi:HK97 gp10 family phage protein